MYFGEFSNREDVCREFSTEFEGTVIFAAYDQQDYDGHAEVIFIRNGKIYMVQGGHCSCYGLEDQFEPVEMSVDGLRRIILDGNGMLSQYKDYLSEVIEMIDTMDLEHASPETAQMALKLAFS